MKFLHLISDLQPPLPPEDKSRGAGSRAWKGKGSSWVACVIHQWRHEQVGGTPGHCHQIEGLGPVSGGAWDPRLGRRLPQGSSDRTCPEVAPTGAPACPLYHLQGWGGAACCAWGRDPWVRRTLQRRSGSFPGHPPHPHPVLFRGTREGIIRRFSGAPGHHVCRFSPLALLSGTLHPGCTKHAYGWLPLASRKCLSPCGKNGAVWQRCPQVAWA